MVSICGDRDSLGNVIFSVFNLWLEYGKFVFHICRSWAGERKAQTLIQISEYRLQIPINSEFE